MSAPPAVIVDEILRVAHRGYAGRIQTGTGGNLSMRLPDRERIVIKASGVSFADCSADTLVTVDLATGRPDHGTPSSELLSHLEIYRRRPAVNGVFHCHAPWAVASAELAGGIVHVTRHAGQKLGQVPVLDCDANLSGEEVAARIGALLAAEPAVTAWIERRHGIFSIAPSLDLAAYNAELVEETAQIAWLAAIGTAVGRARP